MGIGLSLGLSFYPAATGGGGGPSIAPGEDWDGTAGSGFAEAPSDPTRTTAKPVCRLLTPPFQWFTDELLVGVWAAANHGGSLLDNMGLEKVVMHYEGASVDIARPSFQTFNDANGNPVTYFGWWAKLKHDGRNGHAQVWFEAVPKDPTMQRRVIGPYQFSPQAAVHDYEIEVAATPAQVTGERYKTLKGAWDYLKSVSAMNPLITITEAGTYDITGVQFGWTGPAISIANGYMTMTATVPVTISQPAPAPLTDIATFLPLFEQAHWQGENITFDFVNAREYYQLGANREPWFDGVRFTNSGGRYHLFRKTTRNATSQLLRGRPWVTECRFENVWNILQLANLARGVEVDDCWGDLFNLGGCVIGTRVDEVHADDYRNWLPAMTVSYSGDATTATLESSGYKTFTAKENGSTVSTFTVNNTLANWQAGTNYHVANVVDWINSLDGWSATLLDDTRLAAMLCLATGVPGAPFGAQNVKGTTLTLNTAFDIHGDWWQQQSNPAGVPYENYVIADNLASNLEAQYLLWGAWGAMRDTLVVNNSWGARKDAEGVYNPASMASQFTDELEHVVFLHNDVTGQRLVFYSAVAPEGGAKYTIFANSAAKSVVWVGTPAPDLTATDLHLDGDAPAVDVVTNVTRGGDLTTLYADVDAGDFTPTGALLENLKPPRMKYDRNRKLRGAEATLGAVA